VDDIQKEELKKRQAVYDCSCSLETLEKNDFECACNPPTYLNSDTCDCGFDFLYSDYVVDGITYPLVDSQSSCMDSQSWREHHKCPACRKDYHFYDCT